jgi:hypothetical protein
MLLKAKPHWLTGRPDPHDNDDEERRDFVLAPSDPDFDEVGPLIGNFDGVLPPDDPDLDPFGPLSIGELGRRMRGSHAFLNYLP